MAEDLAVRVQRLTETVAKAEVKAEMLAKTEKKLKDHIVDCLGKRLNMGRAVSELEQSIDKQKAELEKQLTELENECVKFS